MREHRDAGSHRLISEGIPREVAGDQKWEERKGETPVLAGEGRPR